MNKEDWEKALTAWENVKKQALIDADQADLYINAIRIHLNNIEVIN